MGGWKIRSIHPPYAQLQCLDDLIAILFLSAKKTLQQTSINIVNKHCNPPFPLTLAQTPPFDY